MRRTCGKSAKRTGPRGDAAFGDGSPGVRSIPRDADDELGDGVAALLAAPGDGRSVLLWPPPPPPPALPGARAPTKSAVRTTDGRSLAAAGTTKVSPSLPPSFSMNALISWRCCCGMPPPLLPPSSTSGGGDCGVHTGERSGARARTDPPPSGCAAVRPQLYRALRRPRSTSTSNRTIAARTLMPTCTEQQPEVGHPSRTRARAAAYLLCKSACHSR
jgi:hypothetical protein